MMAEITVAQFNEKWRHNLAICYSTSWSHRRATEVFLSAYAQEYTVALVCQPYKKVEWAFGGLRSLQNRQIV